MFENCPWGIPKNYQMLGWVLRRGLLVRVENRKSWIKMGGCFSKTERSIKIKILNKKPLVNFCVKEIQTIQLVLEDKLCL